MTHVGWQRGESPTAQAMPQTCLRHPLSDASGDHSGAGEVLAGSKARPDIAHLGRRVQLVQDEPGVICTAPHALSRQRSPAHDSPHLMQLPGCTLLGGVMIPVAVAFVVKTLPTAHPCSEGAPLHAWVLHCETRAAPLLDKAKDMPEQMLASVSLSSWKPLTSCLPGALSGFLKQHGQKFVFILHIKCLLPHTLLMIRCCSITCCWLMCTVAALLECQQSMQAAPMRKSNFIQDGRAFDCIAHLV